MCGIVGATGERNVVPILMEGLRRLEYRGYDSAGVAIRHDDGIQRRRAMGKVAKLEAAIDADPIEGRTGIAHTRWATHGVPSESNAHPHISGSDIAVVHNGIIENHEALRADLVEKGYVFTSETDTEVIAHRIHMHLQSKDNLEQAVHKTVGELEGAYALVVMSKVESGTLILAREGCPVVIGLGIGENFVASDVAALLPVTRKFMFLEEGDIAVVTREGVVVTDLAGTLVKRKVSESELSADAVERGHFRHYMLKEIYEQSRAVAETLAERISDGKVLDAALGPTAGDILDKVQSVHIVACGTSYHAGLVARYWIEEHCNVACTVEIASEYRYRRVVVPNNSLFITISQSGETADTLAALRKAKESGYIATLAICNVPESSLVRESELVMMTRAGPEIGVASTKAFTTQLAALAMVALVLARHHGMSAKRERELTGQLLELPGLIDQMLTLDEDIERMSGEFAELHHALFLGRGAQNPVAMEGALKLKEISYIHAEAYPAGELKHGPLALVDESMPIVTVAPNDDLLEKLKSNLQEVRARGGQLFVFADPNVHFEEGDGIYLMRMPIHIEDFQAPIVYTIPLQLLSYHVAVLKGTDVDQPRNLAKSVTVE
ncbi:MAG: glutamine--fructose-6-phosphate transaminase (isomerizing) [Gammaproteobacteria bacterium]|nr:glutamine--fructose-6-phosphate transaminase (isomerizing) [Gammaproteobacteria bacterium]MCP4090169.1 glutamine--fructose-6-phosphate transaminase (isomerizing) [Gammaproteobacteria bacterium]MCP4277939.1 glutamine--fructose-6-phosphate transaminase (isomerizing) [Gammaproteobacteria bacterium]MCP4832534.1 glutamine--fructose-6-phosphate transaminase (isomerizing) [Gammaproteobacteria bacterium]MCP4928684.1 glutamine--fructose-6-phosphate transaminase (isomerizing) [Gammaproteobacteria bact